MLPTESLLEAPSATGAPAPDPLQRLGHTIESAFQPIYSFSHRRLVGHEALLRARDAAGRPTSPPDLFARCGDVDTRRLLDADCAALHLRNFAAAERRAEWLFLNVDASAFRSSEAGGTCADIDVVRQVQALRLAPQQVAIELLESALPDTSAFEDWARGLKRRGFLLAIDDFGAGQSNFDRVFRLRPHIVKLDRSVIRRAAEKPMVRRAMTQMIALLHQCEALVLVEGVETAEEAEIALDSDAEFVQGYHFGRPAAAMRPTGSPNAELLQVWERCDERSRNRVASYRERVRPYGEALLAAAAALQAGSGFRAACAGFLDLSSADLCFLLDEDGAPLGDHVVYKRPPTTRASGHLFEPLLDVSGARWSRRPYFRRAMTAVGQLQITRPYPTMHSRLMSVTFSVALVLDGRPVVLCGDKLWDGGAEQQPDFGLTAADPLF